MPKRTLEESIDKLHTLGKILRDEISRKYEITNEHHRALREAIKVQMTVHKAMPNDLEKRQNKRRRHDP